MMHGRHALLAMCATVGTAAGAQTAGVQLFAAGSLREALTEVARNFETERGHKVALTFGASGLLRERIENGEAAQVFASADMDHPQRLAQAGSWSVPKVFARNLMCALVAPSVNATPETLLKTLLEPAIRVGTSTPKADPSGDYAWEIFRRADIVQPGAFAALEGKALKLTGAATSRPQHLRMADGRGQSRCVPHPLHQRGDGTARRAAPESDPGAGGLAGGCQLWRDGAARRRPRGSAVRRLPADACGAIGAAAPRLWRAGQAVP